MHLVIPAFCRARRKETGSSLSGLRSLREALGQRTLLPLSPANIPLGLGGTCWFAPKSCFHDSDWGQRSAGSYQDGGELGSAALAEGSLEQGLQRMTKNTNIRTTPSEDAGCEKPHGAGRAQQLWLGPGAGMRRGVPLTRGDRWIDGGAAGQGRRGRDSMVLLFSAVRVFPFLSAFSSFKQEQSFLKSSCPPQRLAHSRHSIN